MSLSQEAEEDQSSPVPSLANSPSIPKKLASPMAPTTFLKRNLGKTIPLALVIVLAVMLIAGIIALIDSIPLSINVIYGYTKLSLGVSPRGDNAALPGLIKKIQSQSPVPIEHVAICRVSSAQVESIVGKWPFLVLGLDLPDMKYYVQRLGATHMEGRLPIDGAPEAIVSRPVATNLNLRIGSTLLGPDIDNSYSPVPVKVVGIADTNQWFMLDTKKFIDANYLPPINLAMVFAHNRTDQIALDTWATKTFKGSKSEVFTYHDVEKQTQHMFRTLFTLLDLVIAMLVFVITLMMGLLINIYQSQRLIEYGLLQAIGYTKKRLIARSLLENILIVALGWALGLLAAYGLLCAIRQILMVPRAFSLNVFDSLAYAYTIPVPVTVLITACAAVLLRFRKFDPVAVVERRIV